MLCTFLLIHNCILPDRLAACRTEIIFDQSWPIIDNKFYTLVALCLSLFLTPYFNPLWQNLKIHIRYSASIQVFVCVCEMKDVVTQAHDIIAAVCLKHHCAQQCLFCVAVRHASPVVTISRKCCTVKCCQVSSYVIFFFCLCLCSWKWLHTPCSFPGKVHPGWWAVNSRVSEATRASLVPLWTCSYLLHAIPLSSNAFSSSPRTNHATDEVCVFFFPAVMDHICMHPTVF